MSSNACATAAFDNDDVTSVTRLVACGAATAFTKAATKSATAAPRCNRRMGVVLQLPSHLARRVAGQLFRDHRLLASRAALLEVLSGRLPPDVSVEKG